MTIIIIIITIIITIIIVIIIIIIVIIVIIITYICFAIISGSGVCDVSQLPLGRLVLSMS